MTKQKNFYNHSFLAFFENTFNVDMTNIYGPFLEYLPQGGKILDIGCGSGRDALYFKNIGFSVDAFDYSENLVQFAKEKTGLDIQHKSFYDLDSVNEYDGIWACASLLHCERSRLIEVVQKIVDALKINGICYMSFKYGHLDRMQNDRLFTDLDEIQARELLNNFKNIHLLKLWMTKDNRPEQQEYWLNMLCIKES
ncbi:class I SAM-dependent methyltransferase [Wohlfahrtiimonas larvae]|uniref:Class I SAM-dependent methyltransferase n=1 Tax=Wohlfahrtiimonas larvae TaxID=1157986 RepID=A0ABP9MRS3_9GAMM|nr:class I SAM-dependent methyltransferase [Wohlfahrtiimonas larvae]